jgi:hypothetical protein
MAFMNTVWGPVDGFYEHGVGTSGWLFMNTVWGPVDGFYEHGVGTSGWLL